MADRIDITSFLSSLLLHFLIIIIFSNIIIKTEPKRVALITDVTLIEAKEYSGQKGEERKTIGVEKKQKDIADIIKKKNVTVKKEEGIIDKQELLKRIEKEKAKLNIGITKDDLKVYKLEEKEQEISEDYIEGDEGGEVVAGGQPSVTGELATRKYKKINWKFPKKLPEETELAIEISVLPNGVIKYVKLIRTSGYPELDNLAISQARKLEFEPLPPNAEQKENVGVLLFKFGAEK